MQTHTIFTNGKGKKKAVNGKAKESSIFANLTFESLESVIAGVKKAAGKMPELPVDLPKGEWTSQALRVLEERYLQKDNTGKPIETPEEMCWRVAFDIASAESRWGMKRSEIIKTAHTFYELLISKKFLPNSPTLMNAGTGNNLQYSGCYVLPVEDSINGIFDALKQQAIIHKSGGGTGFSFTRLRPRGAVVSTSSGVASGPVSFMKVFDAATNEIKQGGKRRGANMGILRVDHPDILEFIHCKEEGGITNFNISVGITNEFMQAYEKDEEYNLYDPRNKEVTGKLKARAVFAEIADGAWRTGDPGLVYLDRINEGSANPVPQLGPVESTNPCGEQPLYPYDSCNLGSIYLSRFVKVIDGKKQVDFEGIVKTTDLAVRFMDDVIEMNPYPLEEVRLTTLAIRRIGLGVGGWADLLIDLEIPYDSDEALALAEVVMKTIQDQAVETSQILAKERGQFPLFNKSIYKNAKPRRNSTLTTIAPTGTTSIIAGTSSGIEPIFALAFRHIVKDKHLDRTLTFVNPIFESVARQRGFWTDEIREKVAEKGVIRDIEEIPSDVRRVFGTAHEIHHDWHIKMQSAFQKYTENAVSKTINMENSVSVEDIKKAYLLSWSLDCKGVTVFRDGCKDAQVLNLGSKEGAKEKVQAQSDFVISERPFVVKGSTYRIATPVGTAFITINEDDNGNPIEVFVNVGKTGSDVTAMAEALGRSVSIAFRFSGPLSPKERAFEFAQQLAGIGGRRSVGFGANKILSLPDALAAALTIHFGFNINGFAKNHTVGANGNNVSQGVQVQNISAGLKADICPSCGESTLVNEEGCLKCYACGHSEC